LPDESSSLAQAAFAGVAVSQQMHSNNDRIWVAIILVTTFVVFRISPVRAVNDSTYEMMFSEQLWHNHSFSFEGGAFPALRSRTPGQIHRWGVDLPYQLVQIGERFYYLFPVGSVILSIPYVALANAMGLSAIDQNGIYDNRGEARIQAGLAALLMAGFSVIVFLTARLLLPLRWSLVVAAATAFGTQVWSTASRAMWSHTWGVFILGFVIWLIVRTETQHTRLRPGILATCLMWSYFVRPTFIISVAGIALYLVIYHRDILLRFVVTACFWLGCFVAYSRYHFGQLLPPYYQSRNFRFGMSWEAFAGTLISPSRGLLIYVPVLAFVAYLLVHYRQALRPRLFIPAISVVVAHFILISGFVMWWAGHCYGPRLTTDLIPWFALLGMLAVEARLQWTKKNPTQDSVVRARTEWSFAALLLVCSITLNGVGAISRDASAWNSRPTNIDHDVNRLWDWKHAQFLAPISRHQSSN
jgi:hypothetical protein